MAIPDYQRVMLPLLRLVEDGQEHSAREAVEKLVDYFGLSEGERNELLALPHSLGARRLAASPQLCLTSTNPKSTGLPNGPTPRT